MREDARTRGRRLLTEGRVQILLVDNRGSLPSFAATLAATTTAAGDRGVAGGANARRERNAVTCTRSSS